MRFFLSTIPRRLLHVGLTTLILTIALIWRRITAPAAIPRLLRWYFQSCGGAFVKLGQLLAMRYDLLPPAYSQELAALLDNVQPQRVGDIRAIIERELGRPLEACFAEFDFTPIGSGSIAQVYRARLPGGEKVAVKVKRLHSEQLFKIDLMILRTLARLSQWIGLLPSLDAPSLTEELSRLARLEFDFRAEARNIQLMHGLMIEDEIAHYTPIVYFDYCRDSIIVMELLEGVWLYELLRAVENGDEDRLTEWRAQGIAVDDVATTLLYSIAVQCYRHRVFHADPHPGNIIVMPGGKLGYIDFGLIGWLDERQVLQEFKLNRNIIDGEFHAAYLGLLSMIEPGSRRNLPRFELEVKELLRAWTWDVQNPYAPLASKSTATLLLDLMALLRRYQFVIPLRTLRLYRTFIVSDMIILKIAPGLNRFDLLHTFIEDELLYHQKQTFLAVTTPDHLTNLLIDGLGSAQELLAWLHKLQEIAPDLLTQINRNPVSPILSFLLAATQNLFNLTLLVLLVILGSELVGHQLIPHTLWMGYLDGLGDHVWEVALALVLLLFGLRSVIGQLRAKG